MLIRIYLTLPHSLLPGQVDYTDDTRGDSAPITGGMNAHEPGLIIIAHDWNVHEWCEDESHSERERQLLPGA